MHYEIQNLEMRQQSCLGEGGGATTTTVSHTGSRELESRGWQEVERHLW